MSRTIFHFGRTPKPAGSAQIDLSSLPEERLNTALASLRRLDNYRRNPVRLDQAIDRVRYAAEFYRQWQANGALIRNIVLRLSDGGEIKVDKVTPHNINQFGFRFRSKFPRNSVLNFYKQADEEFPEVLLYSVDLDRIPASGHSYAKTYTNGQTLMLEIVPDLAGQFNINVDYTMPAGALNMTPSRRERLSKHLPGLAQLGALCLLAALLIMSIQKSRSNGASAGEAAPATTDKVDTMTASPAMLPQTSKDDRAGGQSSPTGLNAEEKSEKPILQAVRQPKMPGVAGKVRASISKPDDAEPARRESSDTRASTPGNAKSSSSDGTNNSGGKKHGVILSMQKPDSKGYWNSELYQSPRRL